VRGIISPPPSSSPLKGEETRCDNPPLKGEEVRKELILSIKGGNEKRVYLPLIGRIEKIVNPFLKGEEIR
jgi:hypothetical protein